MLRILTLGRFGDLGHEGVVHFGMPQDEAATVHVHEEGERLGPIQVVAEHSHPARVGSQKELLAVGSLGLSNGFLCNGYEESVENVHGSCVPVSGFSAGAVAMEGVPSFPALWAAALVCASPSREQERQACSLIIFLRPETGGSTSLGEAKDVPDRPAQAGWTAADPLFPLTDRGQAWRRRAPALRGTSQTRTCAGIHCAGSGWHTPLIARRALSCRRRTSIPSVRPWTPTSPPNCPRATTTWRSSRTSFPPSRRAPTMHPARWCPRPRPGALARWWSTRRTRARRWVRFPWIMSLCWWTSGPTAPRNSAHEKTSSMCSRSRTGA